MAAASAAAGTLVCSLPTKASYSPPSSNASTTYYSPLASGRSAFFTRGDGRRLWSSRRAARLVSWRVGGRAFTASPSYPPSSSGALGCRCLFGLGVPELAVIAGVAALVFGPKKLPEIGKSIGKTVKGFQQAAKELETELKKKPDENTAEKPAAVSSEDERKELESSGTKERA